MKNASIFLLVLCLSVSAYAQQTWKPYSSDISFKIKNAGITVTGRFSGFNGTLKFGADKLPTSYLKGTVDVNTMNTGIGKRDKDLKKEEYFNADKFKTIELSSTRLYKKDSIFAGMFTLTIKGVSRQVEVPFHYIQSGNEASFNGSFHINRKDFGVGGKSMMMADDVAITISLKAKGE